MKRFSRPISGSLLFKQMFERLFFILGFGVSFFIASTVSAQSALRFTPPVFSTGRPPVTSADPTPVPAPTGRTTVRFGYPTPTLPPVGAVSPATIPSLNTPTVPLSQFTENRRSEPLQPLSAEPTAPAESNAAANLHFGPGLQAPVRLEADRPIAGTSTDGNASLFPVAPNPLPLPPPIDREELNRVLQDGYELETESRWADVLTHYETALRIYRNDETLMQRFRLARFHYDVGRRFHDSSYLKAIHTTGFVDALALFEEILSRIQSNYVDMPHWDELFRYGVQDVEIALSDPLFCAKANLKASPDQLRAFLDTMRTTAEGWEIRNRDDLKNGILRLAEIAMQQLGVSPVVVLMEFTCGIVNSLDPYTSFLTPNQLSDTFSMISGNFVGLGVELKSDRESLLIVRVIQGSPALEAGLRDGDRIHFVDGVATKGKDTDSAADLLQGKEGTTVKLVVQSPGKRSREIQVTRRQIDVPSVEDIRMLNAELGYVKLTGFQSKTCRELQQALIDLDRQGMRCLVLDLRHNPGGLLQIGVEVANLFLDEGAIVRTRGRHNSMDTPYRATQENTWKMPLIVLIDEESASASEIVAGAIRDHNRGVIVGKRSYGKGTIQAILSVNSGQSGAPRAGLRLTVEKFYSPLGWPYSGVGVTPHVMVETPHRVTLARQIQGRLQVPVVSRTVTSSPDDPFIKQAIQTSKELIPHPHTASRN